MKIASYNVIGLKQTPYGKMRKGRKMANAASKEIIFKESFGNDHILFPMMKFLKELFQVVHNMSITLLCNLQQSASLCDATHPHQGSRTGCCRHYMDNSGFATLWKCSCFTQITACPDGLMI